MNAAGPFSANLSSLAPSTTYHFRAVAVGNNPGYGSDLTFTTNPSAPTVTTNAATNVTSRSATLNGYLNGLGTASSVQVSFQWGLTTNYGNETTPKTMNAAGPFSANLSSLAPSTTYHFRAKAVGDGSKYGADMTLTTKGSQAPAVTTRAATNITATSAALNGYLNGLGTASSVQVGFQWGLTTNYGSMGISKTMYTTGPFSLTITGLTPRATYHFRAMVVGDGTSYGKDTTFRCPRR
jgi:hypothetical protein